AAAPAPQAGAGPPVSALTPPPAATSQPGFPSLERTAAVPAPAPAAHETAATAAPGPPKDLVLTAISQKDGRPVAALHCRCVSEGNSFDGVKVVRIGEAEVEVEVNGHRMVVTF